MALIQGKNYYFFKFLYVYIRIKYYEFPPKEWTWKIYILIVVLLKNNIDVFCWKILSCLCIDRKFKSWSIYTINDPHIKQLMSLSVQAIKYICKSDFVVKIFSRNISVHQVTGKDWQLNQLFTNTCIYEVTYHWRLDLKSFEVFYQKYNS